jgi:enoyl-CoA hydratase
VIQIAPPPLTVERLGAVLCLGLNRVAKRNSFNLEMYGALSTALGQAEVDEAIRCTLLFAHGEHFTGTKPLVMTVQGYCYTLGIELLLAADVRVAADSTRFAQIEVARGIYPIGGATLRLVQEAGWGNAMRWLLTGETFDAAEALRIGLVQSVAPHGEQFETALRIAQTIAAQAPLAVRATLRSARLQRDTTEAAATARLLPDMLPLLASDDAREGLRAFLERRPGRFTGR